MTRHRWRRVAVAAAAGGVLMAVAACSGPDIKEERATGDTIIIGGVGPLSLPGAVESGQDMKWAMQLAVDDVNADGGVLGKDLKLDFQDTQNMPDVASAVAKKLVDDGVTAVVGEYHSGSALAMIPTLTQESVPTLFVETWNDTITGGDPADPSLPAEPKMIFRLAPTSTYVNELVGSYITDGIKADTVVELYEASDFGEGQAEALKGQLDGTGVDLTQLKVELNQPDYTSILTRVKQEHPDVDIVIFDTTGDTSYVITENAFTVGLIDNDTVCYTDQNAQASEAFWRAVPDGVGCVYMYLGPVPGTYNDTAQSVADRYQKEFGSEPKVWVFEAYDGVRTMAKAIEDAGSTDPDAIVSALEQVSYDGTLGTIEFPYGSQQPVPDGEPSWLWHQWPAPPVQLMEYTEKGQKLRDASIVWPADRQTDGSAWIEPQG